MLRVQIIQSYEELLALAPAWDELVLRGADASVFQTPVWALGWFQVIQARAAPYCLVFLDGSRVVGIAPLCLERRFGARILKFMGGIANDLNGVVCEPEAAEAVGQAIVAVLEERQSEWDGFYLSAASKSQPLLNAVRGALPARWVLQSVRPTAVPTIDLPASWVLHTAKLSPSRRKDSRRQQRRLNEMGKLEFRVVDEPDMLERALHEFLIARRENWQARGRFQSMLPFQRAATFEPTLSSICVQLARTRQVWLTLLCLNERPIAGKLLFCLGGTVNSYLTTYDLRYASYSPGVHCYLEVIRYAIERGYKELAMGRGAQDYKFSLGARPAYEQTVLIAPARPRGRMVWTQALALEQARRLKHRFRE